MLNVLLERVTPFVGVWIETFKALVASDWFLGHTLRGCVDWNNELSLVMISYMRSHPSWVCGLKHRHCTSKHTSIKSHPSWVCGLKLSLSHKHSRFSRHTLRGCVDWNLCKRSAKFPWLTSHPSWVCGLKLNGMKSHNIRVLSHPSWVCGLKQTNHIQGSRSNKSHPSWVCGLKQFIQVSLQQVVSHTLRGCVDWNLLVSALRYLVGASHPSWVCGLKLRRKKLLLSVYRSHPSWVCGLKLYQELEKAKKDNVTPFVGVWIETNQYEDHLAKTS